MYSLLMRAYAKAKSGDQPDSDHRRFVDEIVAMEQPDEVAKGDMITMAVGGFHTTGLCKLISILTSIRFSLLDKLLFFFVLSLFRSICRKRERRPSEDFIPPDNVEFVCDSFPENLILTFATFTT